MDIKRFKIIIATNNYCNYSCHYCSSNIPQMPMVNKHYMDYKLLRLMVANINKYLPDYRILYTLNGGEPTLHPYLNELITILSQTKNLGRIRILTNSSLDFSKIIKTSYQPLEFGISIHYQQMLKHGFDKSLNTVFSNVEYIINRLHGKVILNLLIDSAFPNEIQEYIITKYVELMYGTNNEPVYAKEIISPTNYYLINNFNYHLLENAYNKYNATKAVYPYRGVDIDTYYDFAYKCKLLKTNNKNNVLLHKTWQNIAKNVDIGIICKNEKCTCAICLHIE